MVTTDVETSAIAAFCSLLLFSLVFLQGCCEPSVVGWEGDDEGKEGRTSGSGACSVACGGASWGFETRVTIGVGEGKEGRTSGSGACSVACGGASRGFETRVRTGVGLIGGDGTEGVTSGSAAGSVAFGGASWGLGTRVTMGAGEGKAGVTLGCGGGSLAIGGDSWGFVTRVTMGVVLIGGDGKEWVTSGSGSGATGGASSGVVIGFRTRVGAGSTGAAWCLLSLQRAISPGSGRIFC